MKYPILSNWIVYKMIPESDKYHIKNLVLDQDCVISAEKMDFAKKLDGKTNPYSIRTEYNSIEIANLIEELDDLGVIRNDNGKIGESCFSFMKTIVRTNNTKSKRIASKLLNRLLLMLFIPSLIVGIYAYLFSQTRAYSDAMPDELQGILTIVFNILSIVMGGVLHEFCHAIACRAYGGRVFEYGITIGIIPGFYTLMDFSNVKSVLKQIQIHLAGIEGNILLSGFLLIFSRIIPELKIQLYSGAVVNLIMSFINILAIDGSDGLKALLLLVGVDYCQDGIKKLKLMTRGKRKKRIIKKEGLFGYVKLLTCHMIIVMQRIYPILIVIDIAVLIGVLHGS